MANGGFNISIQGDKKLQKILSKANVTSGEIRAISRRAGNVVKTAARKRIKNINFSDSEGNLQESIIVKGSKRYAGVYVGPNYGRDAKAKRGSHFHLVAFDFVRSDGKRSTSDPIGQVIQEAAAQNNTKVQKVIAKGYGTLLRRKLRKL